jgi:hypothetical protein
MWNQRERKRREGGEPVRLSAKSYELFVALVRVLSV